MNRYIDEQGNLHIMDIGGFSERIIPNFKSAKKMLRPVVCLRCGEIYDLCDGEEIHRYSDCTLYKTPCCHQTVDDRTWVSLPAFRELTIDELESLKTL